MGGAKLGDGWLTLCLLAIHMTPNMFTECPAPEISLVTTSSFIYLLCSGCSFANKVSTRLAIIVFIFWFHYGNVFFEFFSWWKVQKLSMPKLLTLNIALELWAYLVGWALLFLLKKGGLKYLFLVMDASLDLLFNSETSFVSRFIDLFKLSILKEFVYLALLE